jgi:nitrite reductase/ring-hydroxylating ferredoxin subunit
MSGERSVLGRRKLLVLGAAATVYPACGTGDPYAAFGGPDPAPSPGTDGTGSDAGDEGSSSSGARKSGGSSGGSTGNGTSGGSGSSSGSTSSGSGASVSGDNSGGSSGSTSGSSSGSSGSTSGSSSGSSGSTSGSSSGGSDAGTCACSTNGILTLSFSQYPALMNVGGSVTLAASGYRDPHCGSSNIIVIQQSAGKYVALSTACTHACCPVSFTGSGFSCPCHGATFDMAGKPTNLIASSPLPSLPVCSDSCGVHVTIA